MGKNKKLIRELFRSKVFERDGYVCRVCFKTSEVLDAHHITDRNEMPNGGYVLENGISLCSECHLKAEHFHITEKTKHFPNFHPDDLYSLINSSFEKAWNASQALSSYI
ncbi:MAG: HNH endonuclease [Raineya sp.]|nr:HNH endonuclease [Raineya sp.]